MNFIKLLLMLFQLYCMFDICTRPAGYFERTLNFLLNGQRRHLMINTQLKGN